MKLKLFAALTILIALLLTVTLSVASQTSENDSTSFTISGFEAPDSIHDCQRETYSECYEKGSVTVSCIDGISSLYVEHDKLPNEWYATDPSSGVTVPCAQNGFLHEFVDIKSLFGHLPETLVLTFPAGSSICDIYVFSHGEIPDFVQRWDKPLERADLMLVVAHSDDEHLFFAGILPYYAGERDLDVQVVYSVQHYELNGERNHQRPHEQLDGLWAVGIRNYPVISAFPDLYAENEDAQTAFDDVLNAYSSIGVTYNDFLKYFCDSIRRFKPLVIVTHDFNGEYGHGTHVLTAKAVTEAVRYAADSAHDTDSVTQYGGAWCPEKVYVHLYEENEVLLDFDCSLSKFGGKTAFEMSQYGYSLHLSQQWPKFAEWLCGTTDKPITKASQIEKYSPVRYGLYFSKTGTDVERTDLFENVEPYDVRESVSPPAVTIAPPATLHPETSACETTAFESSASTDSISEEKADRPVIAVIVIVGVILCIVIGTFIIKNSAPEYKRSRTVIRKDNNSK